MSKLSYILCALIIAGSASTYANAQFDPDTSNRRDRTEPLPKNIQETMAKQRIAEEKEEFEQLIKRGEEAAQISEDLAESYAKKQTLTSADKEKLKDLEKLLKRIRKDLGGDEGENGEEKDPDSKASAFESLKETAASLVDEIKRSTRHSISAVAIEGSNMILKIVRFLRFSK